MTRARTESADFLFAVKEHAGGTPFIMLEQRGENLKALGDGFLSLNLRPGTSMEEAKALAHELNERVEHVSHTRF